MRRKRAEPRRREAPRWSPLQWQQATMTLHRRSRGKCEMCGKPLLASGVERHHRKRRRDGGDRFANVLLLHSACHTYVTEHPEWARARGYIVSAYDEPAEAAVLLWGAMWVHLNDSGTFELSSA